MSGPTQKNPAEVETPALTQDAVGQRFGARYNLVKNELNSQFDSDMRGLKQTIATEVAAKKPISNEAMGTAVTDAIDKFKSDPKYSDGFLAKYLSSHEADYSWDDKGKVTINNEAQIKGVLISTIDQLRREVFTDANIFKACTYPKDTAFSVKKQMDKNDPSTMVANMFLPKLNEALARKLTMTEAKNPEASKELPPLDISLGPIPGNDAKSYGIEIRKG